MWETYCLKTILQFKVKLMQHKTAVEKAKMTYKEQSCNDVFNQVHLL